MKKSKGKIAVIVVVVAIIAVAAGIVINHLVNKSANEKAYNAAVQLLEQAEYDKAAEEFNKLGDYKDSKDKAVESRKEKLNWGTITNPSAKIYGVNDDIGAGFAGVLIQFDTVKNATGYQYYALYNYGQDKPVSSKLSKTDTNEPNLYFGTQGGPTSLKVRAYKDSENGETIYGKWQTFNFAEAEKQEKGIATKDWDILVKDYVSIEEHITPTNDDE